jgi:dolichyl-phosphate beta-glucosyltransferase
MEAPVRLSIIIPAYNESHRLGRSLESVQRYAQGRAELEIEVLVVDDGSTDGTAQTAASHDAPPLKVRVLVNETNRGKGYSVRRGMLEAAGDVLLMCDADMSTPIEEVAKLLAVLGTEADTLGVVIGSRDVAGAVLDPPQGPLRRLIHWGFRLIRRRIMLPDILDSQCGFKLFTRQAARRIFAREITDGFAFDCEVLALARAMGYDIREVGLVWRNDPRSAVRLFRAAPAMLRDLLRIRRRLRREFAGGAVTPR